MQGWGLLSCILPSALRPGSLLPAVKCSVCKSVSDTYDPYLDVALEIRVRLAGQPQPGGVGAMRCSRRGWDWSPSDGDACRAGKGAQPCPVPV